MRSPFDRVVFFVMLGDDKYILLTTFRRDQTPVKTPVWVVPLEDGKFGFWTSSASGKAKRLAHTEKVIVQASNARGQIKQGSSPIEATAKVVSGSAFDEIRAKVVAKYGFMTSITKVLGTVASTLKGKRIPYGDVGVVITPTS